MTKPRLLDLFCGAGGAARGYQLAGFHVTGVDLRYQPRYAGDVFHQGDAMTWPVDGYDAIHASPPCQAYSAGNRSHHREYPDLVAPTRELLVATGIDYVIENVEGAPMTETLVLCGTQFDLRAIDDDGSEIWLRRHRLFESSVFLVAPGGCGCNYRSKRKQTAGVYGGGSFDRRFAKDTGRGGYTPRAEVARRLMGIDWTTYEELTQAIPPAYTEWIGTQLMAQLKAAA